MRIMRGWYVEKPWLRGIIRGKCRSNLPLSANPVFFLTSPTPRLLKTFSTHVHHQRSKEKEICWRQIRVIRGMVQNFPFKGVLELLCDVGRVRSHCNAAGRLPLSARHSFYSRSLFSPFSGFYSINQNYGSMVPNHGWHNFYWKN